MFEDSVFVNCPFDRDYEPILHSILFCVIRFGLTPRIATERSDSGENRLEKIKELITGSQFSIHDLSRCKADEGGDLARMNMPFELGLDWGCRSFGNDTHRQKVILVLEEESYRYQEVLSDIAGSDIQAHGGNYQIAVRKVRNWLTGLDRFETVGAAQILSEFEDFQAWHLERQIANGFSSEDIQDYPTPELLNAMSDWFDEGMPRK